MKQCGTQKSNVPPIISISFNDPKIRKSLVARPVPAPDDSKSASSMH